MEALKFRNGEVGTGRDWKSEVMRGGSLQKVELANEGVHGYASPPPELFMVRGPNYIQKKMKVPCSESLLKPLGVDWLWSNGKLDHVLANPGSRVMQALRNASVEARKKSFILAINLQVPGKEHNSAVFYFVRDDPIPEGSLLYRFIHEDDAFRNSRFKLINRIVKGPWIVKAAAGNHPACLLGKALTCRYMKGPNYLEIDVDIGSSTVAYAILHLALGYVKHVSVDMAFLIEGQTEDELPEKLLGAVRIAQIEMESASYLEAYQDEKFGSPRKETSLQNGLSWRKLGRSLSKLGSKSGRLTVEDDREK
ncbi:hypothetical protein KC19_1G211900 [Ceratodon purpureus]|uniref:Protein ENHANCED DISEASE RESISTANCE 2 C-terminal domain-containing protein n=1 Tax=Ceratodon purpureus TaxID=3225 RepID=A0A8T0JAD6_CERPU|nr:hypothetical protein KC19_1G211900 [Ceratodon purpureus]